VVGVRVAVASASISGEADVRAGLLEEVTVR